MDVKSNLTSKGSLHVHVLSYVLISAAMLNVNKLVVQTYGRPYTLSLIQAVATCFILLVAQACGRLDLRVKWIAHFCVPGILWALPIALSMHMLAYINPETAVMFRTFSLVGVSLGDFIFFGKHFELNESVSVLCVLVGGVLYALSDIQFSLQGYKWGVLYILSLTANLLILKAAFNSSKDVGDWEKTFYLNVNGSLLLLAFVVLFEIDDETQNFLTTTNFVGSILLFSSCLLGLMIGFFASVTRDALSATAFDVLSNTSKFFTIALSVALFHSRLSYLSCIGLLISVSGGALFSKKIWALLVEQKFCSRRCALTFLLGSIICAHVLFSHQSVSFVPHLL